LRGREFHVQVPCAFSGIVAPILASNGSAFHGLHPVLPHEPMKHFDEPFDIRLIVVNVRTDAKSAQAPGHVNFFGRERLNEPARYASRKTYAQNMRCPKTHLRKRHSRFLQAFGEPRR
jgi:hypothetical protein